VVIDSRNGLRISILRTPVDPQVSIDLSVTIPATVKLELASAHGAISLLGMPASASIQTKDGDIRAQFSNDADIDLFASSGSAPIKSDFDVPLTNEGRVIKTRFGSGQHFLRIDSSRGQISLLQLTHPEPVTRAEPAAPTLIGADSATHGAGTPASTTANEEVSEGDVIRVDSQLVTMNFSVVDRTTNRGLLGLTEEDFNLFEDGSEQKILKFDSASAPFDLILLIDLSGSTRDVVNLIKQSALRFVNAARASDRIGIITFAGEPRIVSPVTVDREVLRQRIETIETAPGDTKLYDAVDFAIRQMTPASKTARRSAIVLMSDGLDGTVPGVFGQRGSSMHFTELINHVQEFEGVIYALWLNTYYEALNPQDTQPEAFETGHDRMRELSDVGGGVFYEVQRLEDLAGAYERVVADLGTVYSLAYQPSNKTRDGKWRAIRVSVKRNGAVARGKRGYYAN
jgi:VWFA-related protein